MSLSKRLLVLSSVSATLLGLVMVPVASAGLSTDALGATGQVDSQTR